MKTLFPVAFCLSVWTAATLARQEIFSDVSNPSIPTPECYPFCPSSADSPTIAQVEAARYRDQLGTLEWVDPRIGTNGPDPSEYGGMVPSVALPFASVRTVPMTRENLVSGCAYHDNDTVNIGFLASRQPAIWMGDYGFATLFSGLGPVKLDKRERGLQFERKDEFVSPYKYAVKMGNDTGSESQVFAEMAGKSRSAIFQYTYSAKSEMEPSLDDLSNEAKDISGVKRNLNEKVSSSNESAWGPFIGVQATRPEWRGGVHIDTERGEISGYNPERMDYRLGPNQALNFRGHFVFRFEHQRKGTRKWLTGLYKDGIGTAHTNATGITLHPSELARWNELGVYAYARFPSDTTKVRIRLGMSLISEAQARYNLEHELPDGTELEDVVQLLLETWKSKTDRIIVEGGKEIQKRILYTGIFHASQYPAEHAELIPPANRGLSDDGDHPKYHYYSAYSDDILTVKEGQQRYQSWSIWDIYRAQWNFLILFEPDRVVDMIRSLLDIYDQSGFLPMWANLAETNIMIATHSDSLIAEAVVKGMQGFDLDKAWEAVKKDGTVPPEREDELRYEDREEYTPLEVRAGLSFYDQHGYVPLDGWSESTSRTLDYAYDDFAIHVLAKHLGYEDDAEFFLNRSKNYRFVFDKDQGVMAARFKNGSFLTQPLPNPLGRQEGFTEGNMFDYSFDVVQDVTGLEELMGGRSKLIALLDRHFREGHNDQSNEPSHHIPYLYTVLGQAKKTQQLVRDISYQSFSDQPDGYAGNEDCGQQSSWYIFSSMGIYPFNPVSGKYVVSSPFFEKIEVTVPARNGLAEKKLTISAPSANDSNVFVESLKVNGRSIQQPELDWSDLVNGGSWNFELKSIPQPWGNDGSK